MWIDIAISVILIFTIVQGYRHGFVHTFIHTIGWLLSIVLGFVWYPHVIKFLMEKTDFYDSVHAKIVEKVSENASTSADSALTGIPSIIKDVMDNAISSATDVLAVSLADSISTVLFNIIGFLIVIIAIKLVLFFLTSLFSKKSNDGIIGGIDGLFGVLAGGVKGIVIVFILLALLVPITSLSGSTFIMEGLESSTIGSYLYDHNAVFFIVKDFL